MDATTIQMGENIGGTPTKHDPKCHYCHIWKELVAMVGRPIIKVHGPIIIQGNISMCVQGVGVMCA